MGFVDRGQFQLLRSAGVDLALVPLRGVAQEIADVIGRDQALFLIGRLPPSGSRPWRVCLYVPKRMPADHSLVRILGFRDAERMRRHFGGEILQPSNCLYLAKAARNASIWRFHACGVSIPDLAEAHRLSEYRVLEILRGKPPEDARGACGNAQLNCWGW